MPGSLLTRQLTQATASATRRYLIQNMTGMVMSYWAPSPDRDDRPLPLGSAPPIHAVNRKMLAPGCSEELQVRAGEAAGVLACVNGFRYRPTGSVSCPLGRKGLRPKGTSSFAPLAPAAAHDVLLPAASNKIVSLCPQVAPSVKDVKVVGPGGTILTRSRTQVIVLSFEGSWMPIQGRLFELALLHRIRLSCLGQILGCSKT